jgi:quercetin dioxygenase-like cupin family protein
MAKKDKQLRPYMLKAGMGWTYNYGIEIIVKVGEIQGDTNATFMEYTTKNGEYAESHTHETEDEMFYVLEGSLTFRCGDESFDVKKGGFIFLPHGIPHSYSVRSKKPARVIVVTSPVREGMTGGWGGFVADMEAGEAELIAKPPVREQSN